MDEFGRRVKAARGFAGLSAKALALRLETSESSIKRLEGGSNTSTDHAKWAERIATACKVPLLFMLEGWAPMLDEHGPLWARAQAARLTELESALDELRREGALRALEDAEQRKRDSETAARLRADQDAPEEGGEA